MGGAQGSEWDPVASACMWSDGSAAQLSLPLAGLSRAITRQPSTRTERGVDVFGALPVKRAIGARPRLPHDALGIQKLLRCQSE